MIHKKIIATLSIVIICIVAFITPFMKASSFIYADDITDNWTQVTTNQQLVDAFRYYCKSRDLTIEGSAADVVTSFTTQTFNSICRGLGIDITALQAHLKYETDGSNIRYLFDSTGITAYNRIFSQFLQDNELSVGDTVSQNNPKTIYSGKVVTDNDHNFGLVYVWSGSDNTWGNIDQMGTPYKYTYQSIMSLVGNYTYPPTPESSTEQTISPVVTLSFNLPITSSVSFKARFYNGNANNFISGYQVYKSSPGRDNLVYGGEYTKYDYSGSGPYAAYNTYTGNVAIGYNPNLTYPYSLGLFQQRDDGSVKFDDISSLVFTSGNQPQNANVFIYAPTTINNNNYEGDTIINDDGDHETPTPNPDGGGTITPPTDTGGGDGADDTDVTFPNFNFKLPEIDWSLGDLSNKFPFSIPFDLVAFFTVMNATPEAPEIDANIPLGDWYTWHFEADFSQFDNYATIIRNVEFIAFCIGLIYLTIRLVKG